jgi:hypothetical protein
MKKVIFYLLTLISLQSIGAAQCSWGTTVKTTCPACAWSVLGNPFSGWATRWRLITTYRETNSCEAPITWPQPRVESGTCGSCG